MQSSSLFVYGSFVSGMVHHHRLLKFVKQSRRVSVHGCVYRLPVGYPVMMAEGADIIEGELLDLEPSSSILWALLDEFHGVHPSQPEKSVFWRKTLQVTSREGQLFATQAYVVNPQKLPENAVYIEKGDWRKCLRENPPVSQLLTERQIRYIYKLGSTTGREIVPIELDLYRELLKLDIIVDKGRRLALTRLGKDVFRYLE